MFFTGLQQGLLFALLALGVYISFKILKIPDLTVEGSFVFGMAVTVMTIGNIPPYLCLLLSFLAGFLAGTFTAFLQNVVKINPVLSGILTATALYSVNLFVLKGVPNVTAFDKPSIFKDFSKLFSSMSVMNSRLILLAVITVIILVLICLFFKTGLGLTIRATGDNEKMVESSSINTNLMKYIGLGLSNGLVGLSGGITAQFNGYCDIYYGAGMIVVGLASVVIGDAIFGRKNITLGLISSVFGCIIYYIIIGLVYNINIPSSSIKLISAMIVIIALSTPAIKKYFYEKSVIREARKNAIIK